MSAFTLYPAIDLRHGKVVRLQHGDPDRQTVFGHEAAAVARRWVDAGATWLHVVNLDGAFDEAGTANWQTLPALTQVGAQVQFGGGVRSLADVARVLDVGVTRVILGTAAIEKPEMVAEAVTRFGRDRIVVGIDARNGRVKTRGWQTDSAVTPIELGRRMKRIGVQTVIYTDINRDGVLTGVNAAASAALAQATGLSVIASGGVASVADVRRAYELVHHDVTGLIIGRALYEGEIRLGEALSVIGEASIQ
jgi:phosphoribosylformimino-5-aminoimidazole carboxamide ribotide isomerase